MKTKLLLSLLLSFYFCLLSSQVPLGFNYQAIARDGSGTILANLALPVKIDIQTSTGTVIYEELFSTVTSNQFGLISLVVGTGVWQSGSAPSFSAIDWKAQPLYLKTIIQYPGTTWTTMGTSQIWAVPYSLTAKEVTGPLTKLGITGTTTDMEEALFEVKNQAGNTVFAVYNEGIRAYVGNGDAKGKKGGFSVGGYDATKGSSTIYNLLTINTDSARLYFDSNPGFKGKKGGFSVGGYDMTKDGTSVQNYLDVTPATTKIFTADTVKGFAVGNVSTGTAESYLKLTPSNYFIGHQAGNKITTGLWNSIMGYKSGSQITTGYGNVFMGYQAGKSNSTGAQNVLIGFNSGSSVTTGNTNVFIGFRAGINMIDGERSVLIGNDAGYGLTTGAGAVCIGYQAGSGYVDNAYIPVTGHDNTFLGIQAGQRVIQGDLNVFVGNAAGVEMRNGSRNTLVGGCANYAWDGHQRTNASNDNVYIGSYAAGHNWDGYNNCIIGSWAGCSNNGYGNVFIGYAVGSNETGSNKLYIDNTNTASPLIWGDFSSKLLNFNGKVGIGIATPAEKLDISSGNIRLSDNYQIEWGGGNNIIYGNNASNFLDFRTSGTDKMRIIANGNVGIGTTTPAQKLDVNGNANFSGDLSFTTGANRFINYPDVTHSLYIGGVPGTTHAPYAIHIVTEGASSIGAVALSIIGTSQNVGIGTTTPANKLDVNGCIRSTAYDTPTSGVGIEMGYIAASNSGFIQCLDRNTTTYKDLRIGGNTLPQGDNLWTLGASATRWKSVWSVNGTIQTSDIRLKTNISALNYGLESIMKLNPISFNWKDEPGGSKHLGLVAQEVIGIIDEAVDTGTDPDKILGINYSQLVPVLIKGMQEQQQQIESQKKENRQLKSELQEMKERMDRMEAVIAGK